MANNQVSRIDRNLLPSSEDAVRQYERTGGHLTHFSEFGRDPLAVTTHLVNQRDIEFNARYPNFDTIFHKVVNSDATLFHSGLSFFSSLTERLAQS